MNQSMLPLVSNCVTLSRSPRSCLRQEDSSAAACQHKSKRRSEKGIKCTRRSSSSTREEKELLTEGGSMRELLMQPFKRKGGDRIRIAGLGPDCVKKCARYMQVIVVACRTRPRCFLVAELTCKNERMTFLDL